ncbi:hypothetical protein EBT31_02865 [bacterium]|nr:hypothetical protein [bacterium]
MTDGFGTDSLAASRAFGVRYPSPFFDVAQYYMPTSVSDLLKWSKYYFITNPWIHTGITKLAEYPVTPIVFSDENPTVQRLYEDLADRLDFRRFQVEIGLDFFTYGNCFVTVSFPLVKFLKCRHCKTSIQARENRSRYTWRDMRFFMTCRNCGVADYCIVQDVYPRNVNGIKLIRLNPEQMRLRHNEVTGTTQYFYRIPMNVRNEITIGDRDTIETLPQVYLEAARESKMLVLDSQNVYHLKRATLAQQDQGWGTPLVFPVLREAFLMQIFRKSQEAIAFEHIVPFRAITPGQVTGGNDGPFQKYNLVDWKRQVEGEVARWKRDPNYIPILPMAMNTMQWNGDAKAYLLANEIRTAGENILVGMGIPIEFVMGGMSWSASNTSLRALENMFVGYNAQRKHLVFDFIVNRIGAFMKWPRIKGHFEAFRMADDLQRTMFLFQLNQAQKVSDRTLLQDVGLDYREEEKRKQAEMGQQLATNRTMQVQTAGIQGAASVRQAAYQIRAQRMMGQSMPQPGAPGAEGGQTPGAPPGAEGAAPADASQVEPGVPPGTPMPQEGETGAAVPVAAGPPQLTPNGTDINQLAVKVSAALDKMPPEDQARQMNMLKTMNNPLYSKVVQVRQGQQGSQVDPANAMQAPVPDGGSQRSPGRTVG